MGTLAKILVVAGQHIQIAVRPAHKHTVVRPTPAGKVPKSLLKRNAVLLHLIRGNVGQILKPTGKPLRYLGQNQLLKGIYNLQPFIQHHSADLYDLIHAGLRLIVVGIIPF